MIDVVRVLPGQLPLPPALPDGADLAALGNLEILKTPLLAVFSSIKCPAGLILKAHDTAKELSASGQAVISGFQSPAEREILTMLLRGKSPIVIFPARGLQGMRTPAVWKPALKSGQLLLLSPFPAGLRRATTEQAELRNRIVFSLADRVLIVHAAPGGKLESLCQDMSAGKANLFTYDSIYNQNMLSLGARVWEG